MLQPRHSKKAVRLPIHAATTPDKGLAGVPGRINQAHEPQRLDPDLRRQQILEAAISYFAEAGFAGQTRELSKRIGVTQSLLYRYYPSKQALIEAVFDAVFLKPWNPEWIIGLRDRSKPLRNRLIAFYSDYAKTAYRPEWIRIYMHAGLAGMGLNRNYLSIVRRRLLRVICYELRYGLFPDDLQLQSMPIREREFEMVWNLHGSMFYWAVRRNIFSSARSSRFEARTADAVDLFLAGASVLYPAVTGVSIDQKNCCEQTPRDRVHLFQSIEHEQG